MIIHSSEGPPNNIIPRKNWCWKKWYPPGNWHVPFKGTWEFDFSSSIDYVWCYISAFHPRKIGIESLRLLILPFFPNVQPRKWTNVPWKGTISKKRKGLSSNHYLFRGLCSVFGGGIPSGSQLHPWEVNMIAGWCISRFQIWGPQPKKNQVDGYQKVKMEISQPFQSGTVDVRHAAPLDR